MTFLGGDGMVFDAPGDDEEFAFPEYHGSISHFDFHAAGEDEEGFVGIPMLVPCEFAVELHYFELAIVHGRDDFRRPMVCEESEFGGEVHGNR